MCFPFPTTRGRPTFPTATLLIAFVLNVAAAESWDLSELPAYEPQQLVSGVIRNYGIDYAGTLQKWEEGFRARQPGVRFDDKFPGSDAAIIGGLVSGVADLATNGREPMLIEYLAFTEAFGHDLTEITVATGAADIKGRTWSLVIYVHRDNPLTKLTLKQLDGIFGAERTGGYAEFKWMPLAARGPEDNIRKWGQLGLTGEWKDQPIHTYGYAFTGMANFFQLKVFHGGDKWASNYREYVEAGKMVADGPIGAMGNIQRMLTHELAQDRYGIAWTGIAQAEGITEIKPLALAATAAGPFVVPNRRTVQQRIYPLTRSVFIQLNREPGQPLDAKQREFLRYILSREGQQAVADNGNYLPLTAEVVRDQRARLDAAL